LKFLLERAKESANQICNTVDQATPLHFAVLHQNFNNCKLLLKNGAAPNAKDNVGNTPLHMATASKNLSIVRVLDQYGADARIPNID